MTEYLNKWFWIKDLDGILDLQERELWCKRHWNSLQCIGDNNDALTLFYASKNITIHARKDCVEERPAPKFVHGDVVLITKKHIQATVEKSIWHFNDCYYYYHVVDENGKMLKKRYMADELEKMETAK